MNFTSILSILRDSTWQFVGVVIAVVALIIAVISLAHQLRRKSLFVTVKGYQRLVDAELAKSDGDLSVTFKGKVVNKLSTLSLCFANNGSIPIASDDFDSPIEVSFKNNPKFLRAHVSGASPEHLPVHVNIEGGLLAISPLLLNPKDEFTIEILLENMPDRTPYDVTPSIKSRIRGLRNVDFMSSYVPVAGIRTPIIGIEIYPATIAVVAIAGAAYYLYKIFA